LCMENRHEQRPQVQPHLPLVACKRLCRTIVHFALPWTIQLEPPCSTAQELGCQLVWTVRVVELRYCAQVAGVKQCVFAPRC
jgi:hypothetical protein